MKAWRGGDCFKKTGLEVLGEEGRDGGVEETDVMEKGGADGGLETTSSPFPHCCLSLQQHLFFIPSTDTLLPSSSPPTTAHEPFSRLALPSSISLLVPHHPHSLVLGSSSSPNGSLFLPDCVFLEKGFIPSKMFPFFVQTVSFAFLIT